MRHFIAFILLGFTIIVLLFFTPFIVQKKLPLPLDTMVGLYHPFRDFYAVSYPRGIPFKNFLITDPALQQYPWRQLSITTIKKFEVPLWNPYSFSGTPLLANFQSAVLYPLNVLLLFLPFTTGWGILVLLQPLLGGIFLFFYLRYFKLHSSASILGAITFAFCGANITWMEWNTIGQVFLWLPLVLLSQEQLLKKFSFRWIFILLFALVSQIFAGHLQVWFYSIIFSNIYLVGRLVQVSWRKKINATIVIALQKYIPFLLLFLTVFIVGSVQLLPTFQLISQSAREVDQVHYLQIEGWFLPWQHLVQFIAPDFFGNPTTLNYWGTWNYGELTGYIGILPCIFAFYAIFRRRDKKTLLFSAALLGSLIFALPTIIGELPFLLHLPFLSTAQPTRLLFITDFSLAVLAALGLDMFIRTQKSIKMIIFGLAGIFVALWIVVFTGKNFFPLLSEALLVSKSNLIVPTAIFICCLFVILFYQRTKNAQIRNILIGFFIVVTVIDLFRFGHKFLPFTSSSYLYPQTKTLSFLQRNSGNFRVMTTDRRILPPNISIQYKLKSIDGYDPLYIRRYAEFVAAMERGNANISAPFGFNRIITPHNYDSPLVNLLGVKYVLSLSDLSSKKLKKVFQEGETRVYENQQVLPRVFFVNQIQTVNNRQEAIQELQKKSFDSQKVAIVESEKPSSVQKFSLGKARIIDYDTNRVDIEVDNTGEGFLVLTDVYYSTWHAWILESFNKTKELPIVSTDFLFRGIIVPAGKHIIRFEPSLL